MVAQKRHHLSDVQVQMARELGFKPDSLRKIDNHKQEPWKTPLPQHIENLYEKRFKREQPEIVKSLKQQLQEDAAKRAAKKKAKDARWKTQARMTPGAKVDLTPEAKIGLTPLSKIKMTPVDIEPAGDFICIFGFRFGRRGIKPKKHEYKVKKHSPVSRIGNGNKKHQQCF